MMSVDPVLKAFRLALHELKTAGREFALVGGIAVSVRAEVRFTRDVDLAVVAEDDEDAEELVSMLRHRGYRAVATVEHEATGRLSTVRLISPSGIKVDLLFASSGIEREIISRATPLELPEVGAVDVAEPEELLAMKVLSMDDRRLQDRIDARRLISRNPSLDLDRVRSNLQLIASRGFHRDQNLQEKLTALLKESS